MLKTDKTKMNTEQVQLLNGHSISLYGYSHRYAKNFGVWERNYLMICTYKKSSYAWKPFYCAKYHLTSR